MTAKLLADFGPVFFLNMGMVILGIGSGAGALHRGSAILEMAYEMPVEKLRSIITVETPHGKRQRIFNVLDLSHTLSLDLAPGGALLGPTGGEISNIQGINKPSGQRVATMGHGIGFQETWAGCVPRIGLDGDLIF
jgi:hypothetical protein